MSRAGGNIKNSKFDELVSLGIINLERLLILRLYIEVSGGRILQYSRVMVLA